MFSDHDPIVSYAAHCVHHALPVYDPGEMALCVVVKLDEVERVLANPPAGHKLVAVCQHQGTDPKEVAEVERKRAEEEKNRVRDPNAIYIMSSISLNNAFRIYEWRELYYEAIDTSSLLPGGVPTSLIGVFK